MQHLKSDPDWYKTAVFYEVYVRSFFDSNADGFGDFRGMIDKLDYFEWLGVDCIWMLPFYKSPLRDGGYDISDFYAILPEYGNLNDFMEFVEESHQRGIRVVVDFVVNHTSDEHPWFQEARMPGSDKRDWYVWSDDPETYSDARVIFIDTEKSNWTWDEEAGAFYWHRFFAHQPDLNYDNPEVQEQLIAALKFWLDLGLDGFRLDAVPYLFEREGTDCENLPETHEFLKRLRKELDSSYEDIVLLAEANQWPSDVVQYFGDDGDECHMCFHFPLMPRMFMAARRQVRYPIVEILDQTPEIPSNCQWGIFLRNHDELTLEMVTDEERDYMYNEYAKDPRMKLNLGIRRRLAPLLENSRDQSELFHAMLLSFPGRRSCTTATRSAWATTSTSVTATACGRRCSGAATGTQGSRWPISPSSTCPCLWTRSTGIKLAMWRPSFEARTPSCTGSGSCWPSASSIRCSGWDRSRFCIPTTLRSWPTFERTATTWCCASTTSLQERRRWS